MKIDVADVMKYFNQGKMQWWGWKDTSAGEVYSNLELLDETATMPTEEQVNAKIAEITIPNWKVNRQSEYPGLLDCIHALLDGGDTLTDLQAARQAVKDKYPKP